MELGGKLFGRRLPLNEFMRELELFSPFSMRYLISYYPKLTFCSDRLCYIHFYKYVDRTHIYLSTRSG